MKTETKRAVSFFFKWGSLDILTLCTDTIAWDCGRLSRYFLYQRPPVNIHIITFTGSVLYRVTNWRWLTILTTRRQKWTTACYVIQDFDLIGENCSTLQYCNICMYIYIYVMLDSKCPIQILLRYSLEPSFADIVQILVASTMTLEHSSSASICQLVSLNAFLNIIGAFRFLQRFWMLVRSWFGLGCSPRGLIWNTHMWMIVLLEGPMLPKAGSSALRLMFSSRIERSPLNIHFTLKTKFTLQDFYCLE